MKNESGAWEILSVIMNDRKKVHGGQKWHKGGHRKQDDRISFNKHLEETEPKCEQECQPNQSVSSNEYFLHFSWKSK